MMRIVIRILISFAYAYMGWIVVKKIEPGYAVEANKKYPVLIAAAYLVLTGGLVYRQARNPYLFWYEGIFWATLALAAFCDYCTTEVYDIVFFPAMMLGGGYILYCGFWPEILEIAVFTALQVFIFRKMYGGADCLAFVVCALYLSIQHCRLLDYLLHMMFTFIALATVQMLRRNINRQGNLKVPVPLIPYIAAVMLVVV